MEGIGASALEAVQTDGGFAIERLAGTGPKE